MKAVVLATCHATAVAPLTQSCPKALLPVANRPLLDYVLHLLQHAGIQETIIVSNGKSIAMQHALRRRLSLDMPIRFHDEPLPRGTAGCLQDLRGGIGDAPFVVINGGAFFDFDLARLIAYHREKGGIGTVGVTRTEDNHARVERIVTAPDHTIDAFVVIDRDTDRDRSVLPCDVYVFEPEIFDLLPEKDYFDIKEQLLGRVKDRGMSLYAIDIQGFYRGIMTLDDYFRLNMEVLKGGTLGNGFVRVAREIQEGIWSQTVDLSLHQVTLIPPVLIGEGCQIKPGACVVGPVILGDACYVGAGAYLRESLVWSQSVLLEGAQVEESLICSGCTIDKTLPIRRSLVADGIWRPGELHLLRPHYKIKTLVKTPAAIRRDVLGYRLQLYLKRLLDVSVSGISLVFLSPLMLLIGMAIKLDSPGKVFFRQYRCGLDGKAFRMVKFRTMIQDAKTLQAALECHNEVDGPMFKMAADPRVTRVGRVLRETYLDELPQLWNVLKGEMSLVGPRPLETKEMRFHATWRETRLKVKPGITGLWQVHSRESNGFSSWIRYDIDYVKNHSFWLDIRLLTKTIWITLIKLGSFLVARRSWRRCRESRAVKLSDLC